MVRLGDVGLIITGNTPKTSDNKNYDSNDICFIKPSDIDEDLTDIYSSEYYISEYARSKARIVPVLSVLVTCIGIVGKVGINAIECAFNQQINAIVPDKQKCDYRYLAYAIQYEKPKLQNTANAPVVPILNKSQFSDIEIPLPSLEEQRKIAVVLDKVSDLIAKRRQQLEKLDFLVKVRFVEMFGDPVSNPKGWMMIPLKECLTGIDNGQSFICSNQSRHYEWPAILKLSAVTYGEYRPDENKALLNISQFIKSAEIHAGDLLFTRKNTPDLVGMAAYVYHSPSNLMMPDLIFRLNTKENCAKIFLWQLINHNLFRSKIQSIASGTAKSMSNISKERLLKLKIYLPPIELQNQFSDFVEQTEKTKTSIKTSLAKLETLKKALMQEYFG